MLNRLALPIVALFLSAQVSWAAASLPNPTEDLKSTIDPILEVLANQSLDTEGKRDKIRAIIGERFDFWAMSQRTLGKNWRGATAEQKKRFTNAFRTLLEETYLVMVEQYTDQKVNYVNEKIKKQKYAQVDTVIISKDSPSMPVNYKMRIKKDNQWWVYDVVIEGVSMISNYRTSYQEIVKNEGVDQLISKIEKKNACPDCGEKTAASQ